MKPLNDLKYSFWGEKMMKTAAIVEGTWMHPKEARDYWVQGFLVGAVIVGLLAWAYIWAVGL